MFPTITLTAYDYFTNVVLMVGWIVSNAAWDLLALTLLAGVPFIALVVSEAYEARRAGQDEGDKGMLALNRIESRLYAMLLVYVFCALPLLTVTFAPVTVDQAYKDSCGVRRAAGGTATPVGGAVGGQTAQIPVWWATVHAVSRGVTNAMISALPCQTDYLYIRTEINNTAIRDPVLRNEVARFQRACYGAARSQLFLKSAGLTPAQAEDVDWIGSSFFLSNPGYYDTLSAHNPVNGFPFDPATDTGRGTLPAQGGYPTCSDWWSTSGIGLKDRLHDQIDTNVWNKIHAAFTSASAEDYAIRGLLQNHVGGAQGNSDVTADFGGSQYLLVDKLAGVLGFMGTVAGTLPAEAMKDVMSRGLPMVLHLLMMAVIVSIPFLLVMSGYSFKVAGVLTFSYFGLTSIPFWFEVSRWLSNNLTAMVYDSQAARLGFIASLTSAYDQGVLGLVLVAMQLIFPLAWLSLLGWSGWKVGDGVSKLMQSGSKDVGSTGNISPTNIMKGK